MQQPFRWLEPMLLNRAQQIAHVHAELSRRVGTDERVAVLLEARSVLRDSGSSIVVLELVDRELDLLNRWVDPT